MERHSQITDGIFISNWQGSVDQKQLIDNKIKYVLCLNEEYEKKSFAMDVYDILNIKHKYIKIKDNPKADLRFHFADIIDFMKNEQNGNVLVHCTEGVSRSCSSVIAYLMHKIYMNESNLISERIQPMVINYVKSKRKYCNPNHGFLAQLYEFESRLIDLRKNIDHRNGRILIF